MECSGGLFKNLKADFVSVHPTCEVRLSLFSLRMENGFIKLYRQIQDWQWYSDSATVHFFIHCILSANWKDKKWQGMEVKRGQFITSYANLSLQTGLSVKQIRTRIKRLEEGGEIEYIGASNYSVITVCKYNTYQPKHEDQGQTKGKQRANKGQTKGNNEEGKEYKEGKNNYVQFVDFWNECNGCNLRMTDKKRTQIKNRLETYTEEELKKSIRNRSKDEWINGEGKKYKTNWDSFWRNDEKPERYLMEREQSDFNPEAAKKLRNAFK